MAAPAGQREAERVSLPGCNPSYVFDLYFSQAPLLVQEATLAYGFLACPKCANELKSIRCPRPDTENPRLHC